MINIMMRERFRWRMPLLIAGDADTLGYGEATAG